jgi:hypothetical protein
MKQIDLFEEPDHNAPREHQAIVASFSIERRDLIEALRAIKRPLHVTRKDLYNLQFELFVMDQKVLVRLYENEYWINTKTKGTCRTVLFFKDVLDTLVISKEFWIDVEIKSKTIGLNQVNLTSPTEPLDPKTKEIPLSSIVPPIHSSDTFAVTPDKQFFTHDLQKGFYFETIQKDITFVRAALKKYGIPKKEIEKFIYSYLKSPKP